MIISAGIIIENYNNQILGCHCTGRKFEKGTYDIPKGQIEDNEMAIKAVIRECKEETGITLSFYKLEDLGEFDYLHNKRLHLFKTKMDHDIFSLKCSSVFKDKFNKTHPEINGYKWIEKKDLAYFYPTLSKLLEQLV